MVSLIQSGNFVLASDKNLGAIEVTTFISLVLLGISFSQGYTFFMRCEDGRHGLKLLVTVLMFLELLHSFTASQTIYYDTITNWKDGRANSYPLSVNVLSENMITFLVQCFFSYRIYRLSENIISTSICFGLSALRFLGAVFLSAQCFIDVPRQPNGVFIITFSWLITSSLAVGAAADVLIAIFMVYNLRKMTSPLNLRSTSAFLNRLIRWSLRTGVITSMTSLSVIICFQALSSMIWFGAYIILAKLYSISLLVSLNTKQRGHDNGQVRIATSSLQFEGNQVSLESCSLPHLDKENTYKFA